MEDPRSFCGGPFQTNGYLVRCGEKSVLFDAPMGVANWVAEGGNSVDILVLTHLHHDHVMDAAAVVSTFGCPVWSHSDPSDELTLVSNLSAMTGIPWKSVPAFTWTKFRVTGNVVLPAYTATRL